jgi:hypothetical protein
VILLVSPIKETSPHNRNSFDVLLLDEADEIVVRGVCVCVCSMLATYFM